MNPQNPQVNMPQGQPMQNGMQPQITPPTSQGQISMEQSLAPTTQNTATPMPIGTSHLTPRQMMANHTNTVIGRLGFVNSMQKQLLEYKAKKAGTHVSKRQSVTSQNAPQQPQTPEPKEDTTSQIKGLESRLMDEIKALKEDLKPKDKNKELEDLKKQIEEVLNESD